MCCVGDANKKAKLLAAALRVRHNSFTISGVNLSNVAGEEGFEPSHAGIKIQCLNQLGDSPNSILARSITGDNQDLGIAIDLLSATSCHVSGLVVYR